MNANMLQSNNLNKSSTPSHIWLKININIKINIKINKINFQSKTKRVRFNLII